MCEGEFLNKDWPPGEQAGRRRRGGNWASFSGMSYVMVATTWVDGEAESDVGLTARPTPCRERNSGSKEPRKFVGTKISGPGSRGGWGQLGQFQGHIVGGGGKNLGGRRGGVRRGVNGPGDHPLKRNTG